MAKVRRNSSESELKGIREFSFTIALNSLKLLHSESAAIISAAFLRGIELFALFQR